MSRGHDPVQPPVSAYGVVGDRRSTALIADGSVDWWCPGRFDAPSACARLLDPDGGRFLLAPEGDWGATTAYDGDTNVLRTTWTGPDGELVVHDAMPLDEDGTPSLAEGTLLRVARCTRGRVRLRLRFEPRPEYASRRPEARRDDGRRARFVWPSGTLTLSATRDVDVEDGSATADWELGEGDVVAVAAGPGDLGRLETASALSALDDTRSWWLSWAARCRHEGPHRDAVVRSALALALLTYAPTGGLVAAATTSLPEWVGGHRTWDYRYVWMRDAALAVDAFVEAGHEEQALRLGEWIHRVLQETPHGHLDVLYRVDGAPDVAEHTLEHLEGYRGSRPVRVGNGAAGQFQLDVYGELVECLHLCRMVADDAHEEQDWDRVREIVDGACERWREPDHGIWEMRGEPRHFVLSKVMAWVAIDRGLQAVRDRGLPGPEARWRREAEAVRESVLREGFDTRRNTFVQSYGSDALDASSLLIPILGFLPPDDPRVRETVEAVRQHLADGDLVHRYLDVDDGVDGPQGAFAACSFWLAEALADGGRLDDARRLFGDLVRRATPLGLYAQSLGPDGEHLGNFPQALTHIALISAAAAIERAGMDAEMASPHRRHARGRGFAKQVTRFT